MRRNIEELEICRLSNFHPCATLDAHDIVRPKKKHGQAKVTTNCKSDFCWLSDEFFNQKFEILPKIHYVPTYSQPSTTLKGTLIFFRSKTFWVFAKILGFC